MDAPYQDIVAQLRFAFPKPVSDRMHDAYFVFSFLRALDQVDALKSAAPMLGTPVTLDYARALERRLEDAPLALEAVTAELVQYLSGMFIWGHPRAQINVVPSPTIASLIGGLLPSIYNPNLVSDETSRRVCAGRGRSRGDDGGADRLRPGAGRRRVHLRRHRHAPLRREDRAREGRARRAARRPADAGGDRLLDAGPLRVPDGRQLARTRRGPRDQGRRDRRPRDAPRRAVARRCTTSPRPARGSRASSRRWARPMRSASTTSRAS